MFELPTAHHNRPAFRVLAAALRGLVAGMLIPLVLVVTRASAADDSSPAAVDPGQRADSPSDPLDGLPIVRIIFIRRDIFDTEEPTTSAWPYRLANNLHVTSTERFLRRMLLFSEGDPYFAHAAEESARILRSTDLMNPVIISAREVEGGVEVTVDTRERWTLQVGAKFGLSGNRSNYAFSFDENNVMGNGQAVNFKYSSDNERSSWTYGLYDPNILGSRWRARIEYEDASDGHGNLVAVDYPFYSLATPHSWGIVWNDTARQSYLYSASHDVVEGTTISESFQLSHGFRLPGERDVTRRLTVGYDYRRESYSDWAWTDDSGSFLPPDPFEVSGVRIGYQQVVDRFLVVQGFRSWVSQEDVALGPNFDLGITVSLPSLGGDMTRILVDGSLSAIRQHGTWMLLGEVWGGGRIDTGELRNAILGGQFVASQMGDRSWLFRLAVETSHELDRNRQLALGSDLGLRGWDPDYFDGTGRAVANLQWRIKLKDDILHLFSLGMVAFADAGYTWQPRVGPDTDGVRADVGIGLVADVPQIGLVKLLRLEIAFPDDGSGYTTLITTHALF